MRPDLISFVLPNLAAGGIERLSLVLSEEFLGRGYLVDFVLRQNLGALIEAVPAGANIRILEATRARNTFLPLVRYLNRYAPKAVIAAPWPLTCMAPIAARFATGSTKVLVSEHNTLSKQYGANAFSHWLKLRVTMALGYRLADSRVAVSNGVAQDISALSGLNDDRFNVVYNPLWRRSVPSAPGIERANEIWDSGNRSRVLTVASLKKQKNQKLLLDAIAKIDEPNVVLTIVGEGAERSALEAHAQNLRISDRVRFAGFQEDPTPFYQTADLFALSSDYEGFGNVIVEALAAGLPVVSTDCPSGPGEILNSDRLGELVPVGDAAALAAAIERRLIMTADRQAAVQRANEFAPDIIAGKYLEALNLPQIAGQNLAASKLVAHS